MQITRRDFLKWAAVSAATLGLSATDLFKLEQALASGSAPPVIWLQGSLCTGCTISLLNSANPTVDDILLHKISMRYHPNLNAAAGELAISSVTHTVMEHPDDFILCIEGGIPTSIDGNYCIIGEKDGEKTVVQ